MLAARIHRFAFGSKISLPAMGTPRALVPPTIRTRPSSSRVAVCATCPSSRSSAGAHAPESVALACAGIGLTVASAVRSPASRTRRAPSSSVKIGSATCSRPTFFSSAAKSHMVRNSKSSGNPLSMA